MGCLARAGEASVPTLRRAALYGTLVASFNCEAFSVERLKTLTLDEVNARGTLFTELLSL
jgi:hypothetical protein